MISLIKNLVKGPQNKRNTHEDADQGEQVASANKNGKKITAAPTRIIKSAIDMQRLKLEKLMKNPEKIIIVPESRKEKDFLQSVPTFVRNVMGSSAGAGSGEFHVYRHLRRKEYARQKMIQATSIKQKLDEAYQMRMEENRRKADEKTAKKRLKRLKKKQRAKRVIPTKNRITNNNKGNPITLNNSESSDENMEDDTERIKEIMHSEPYGCKQEQEQEQKETAVVENVEGEATKEQQVEQATVKDVEAKRRIGEHDI